MLLAGRGQNRIMRKLRETFTIVLFALGISGAAAQQYQVTAVGFYNFENLFDTLASCDMLFPARHAAGEYPYMQTVPKATVPEGAYEFWGAGRLSDWLLGNRTDAPDTVLLDKFDEEFTPDGAYRYTSPVYREKLANLARVVSEMGTGVTPDGVALLGVAEVEQLRVLEDFVKEPAIASRNYRIIHHNSMDFRGIDVALLYQPRYFKPVSWKLLPVDIRNNLGQREFTRDVLWVEGYLNGEYVHVFVNHWPSRSGGAEVTAAKREAAAQVSRTVIDSLRQADPDVKAIVMGDLNDDPVNNSLTRVLRAEASPERVPKAGMYNPFAVKYKKGEGSNAYRDAWSLFDQIVLSPAWLNQDSGFYFYKAEIFNKPYLLQKSGTFRGYPFRSFINRRFSGGFSDHFPVLIYLVKPVE